ncbi:MAG TPA: inositol monophosphatase family protein [Candidatus Limnocylindrales bacterium]|nr:inositol monophosphatase family protein [Candidatus Limnocylindrales bacterium]
MTAPARPPAAPSATATAADLAFATDLAREAGRLLMERYERVERVDYKSARDIVTEVDHLSEELIIAAIRERHPGDGIQAEESGDHASAEGHAPAAGNGRVWIIDPVDGTINYANGIPFFCVSIGLAVDGRPSVGVVFDPSRAELFAATADGPATLNGEPIEASDKDKMTDFVVQMALSGRAAVSRTRAVRKAIRISRSMGSSALALAYVANGRFDAFIQQGGMSNWDVAAAGLIAERAGATVTAMDGGPWFDIGRKSRGVGAVAAPAAHHATLLALTK